MYFFVNNKKLFTVSLFKFMGTGILLNRISDIHSNLRNLNTCIFL
jgi:hypothetical protein